MSTRRRKLRSIVVRVVVFLLLGAVVNVAVAWGCACYAQIAYTARERTTSWIRFRPEGWPMQPSTRISFFGTGMTLNYDDASGPMPSGYWVGDQYVGQWNPDAYRFAHFTVGWPWRSMQWSLYDVMQGGVGTEDYFPNKPHGTFISGLSPPRVADDEWRFQRRLPLQPIWPGFAINTLFYSAILWLLFAAPGRVRRWRRIRRGLCAKCAYPVGASDVCTECGAIVEKGMRGSRGLPSPAPPAGGASTP